MISAPPVRCNAALRLPSEDPAVRLRRMPRFEALPFTLLLVASLAGGCRDDTGLPPIEAHDVALDLVAELPKATVVRENEDARLRAGLLFTGAKRFESRAKGGERPAILASPPSELVFRFRPERGQTLGFAAGLDYDGPGGETARVRFRVRLDGGTVFEHSLDRSTPTSGDWVDADVDLDPYAGKEVSLVFETTANAPVEEGPIVAGWGSPRIFERRRVSRTAASRGRPNVLLVVVDTLRADAVRTYGCTRETTPAIDALASRGTLYERAISTSGWTWPATASILTGLYPYSHGVRRAEQCYLSDAILTIAEHFQAAGVTTAAFSANSLICRSQNFSQGFETFQEFFTYGQRGTPVAEAFCDWLARTHRARFFAYVHLMDPHAPYAPPPECLDRLRGDRRSPEDDGIFQKIAEAKTPVAQKALEPWKEWMRIAYDADVLEADRAVGRMVEAIAERGLADRTIVIVTSDHGEEFFEHGGVGHARTLYDELLHVPLVVADPRRKGGERVSEMVETVQIFPTICELANLPAPRGLALGFAPRKEAVAYATTDKGETNDPPFRNQNAIRTPEWKLVFWPEFTAEALPPELTGATLPEVVRLFDLVGDPGERTDVAVSHPDRVNALRPRLRQWMQETSEIGPRNVREPSAETIRKLKALGYIANDPK
jgi:choline-sulfatase